MKISLFQLLMAIGLISFLFAITFTVPPMVGWLLWAWINVGVFPPFIIVSVYFSQGARRAFLWAA